MSKFTTLGELMAEEEERLRSKAKAEIAAEKAAWDALPQAEKDRITAEREAKWAAIDIPDDEDWDSGFGEDEDEDENESDEDEDEA